MRKYIFNLIYIFCGVSIVFLNQSCRKPVFDDLAIPAEQTPSSFTVAIPTNSVSRFESFYVYDGDNYRDPFIPLMGASAQQSGGKRPKEFNPANLSSLIPRGILSDNTGKFALLSDISGASFVLKDGKLIDYEGKIIPNVTGEIKKNVIVINTLQARIELKLKED